MSFVNYESVSTNWIISTLVVFICSFGVVVLTTGEKLIFRWFRMHGLNDLIRSIIRLHNCFVMKIDRNQATTQKR